jgi:glycogen debranching enzyme
MSVPLISKEELIPIPAPYTERSEFQVMGPRKVDNLTLIDGKTFLATRVSGDIAPPRAPDVGFFHDDTRFLSFMEMRVGGLRTVLLSSNTEKTFLSQIELTTSNIHLRDSLDLPENTIHIRREQMLDCDVLLERIAFGNFNHERVEVKVEIEFAADFVDVFQVRGMAREELGQYYQPVVHQDSIAFYYRGLDNVMRSTVVELSPAPAEISDQIARWEVALDPLEQVEFTIRITPRVEGMKPRGSGTDFNAKLKHRREVFEQQQRRIRCDDAHGGERLPRFADSCRRGQRTRHRRGCSVVRDDVRTRFDHCGIPNSVARTEPCARDFASDGGAPG